MRLFAISAIVVAIIGGLLFAAANGSNEANTADNVTFAQVQSDVSSGAKFYDVRTPEEYTAGHFASAENLPLGDIQAGTLPDVPKDTKIYLQCQSGNRSGQATKILEDAGYTNVTDLGGITDVQQIGGQLET